MTTSPERRYLSPRDAAELMPFGNADWYRQQMRTGRLWATRINGRWYTTAEAIEDMAQAGSNSQYRRRRRRHLVQREVR